MEKRSHPAAPTTARPSPGEPFDAAAFVAAAAGVAGSPVISHLAKGGRFAGGLILHRAIPTHRHRSMHGMWPIVSVRPFGVSWAKTLWDVFGDSYCVVFVFLQFW